MKVSTVVHGGTRIVRNHRHADMPHRGPCSAVVVVCGRAWRADGEAEEPQSSRRSAEETPPFDEASSGGPSAQVEKTYSGVSRLGHRCPCVVVFRRAAWEQLPQPPSLPRPHTRTRAYAPTSPHPCEPGPRDWTGRPMHTARREECRNVQTRPEGVARHPPTLRARPRSALSSPVDNDEAMLAIRSCASGVGAPPRGHCTPTTGGEPTGTTPTSEPLLTAPTLQGGRGMSRNGWRSISERVARVVVWWRASSDLAELGTHAWLPHPLFRRSSVGSDRCCF